jgi:TfoX/Sxy family transcriptional regulator of competence genes
MAAKMPRWKPAPEKWVRAFDEAMPAIAGAERRKMFGYPAVFLNGNMVAGLHEQGLILRLPEELRERANREGGRPFEVMGRVMREYVVAPEALAKQTDDLRAWLKRSFDHVAKMPKKAKKKK